MYTVDGYDKDNDVYAEYWRGKDLEKAKEIATILDNIAMHDGLIRWSGELIDWVQVTNENNEMVYLPRN